MTYYACPPLPSLKGLKRFTNLGSFVASWQTVLEYSRTCSLTTQFPYALKALPSVLAEKWDDPDFKPYRDAFPEETHKSPEALEAHVKDLTERDVKVAYLKNLQGQ